MYQIGEFRNSVFEDSSDEDPFSATPSKASSPSVHFQMIRQQMTPSAAGSSLNAFRGFARSSGSTSSGSTSSSSSIIVHADDELAASSDHALPTRFEASSFMSAYKTGDSLLDRDQALRHSHVMETVRSLPRDEQTGRLAAPPSATAHPGSRARKLSSGLAAARKSSTLPAAPAKRQAVATSRVPSASCSSATSLSAATRGRRSPHSEQPTLRRYTSDPTGVRANSATRSLPRQQQLERFAEGGSSGGKRHLVSSVSTPSCGANGETDGDGAGNSRTRVRPPRQLPPMSAEDLKPKLRRTTSLASTGSSSNSRGSLLASKGYGSLRERPNTGTPARPPPQPNVAGRSPTVAGRKPPKKPPAKLKTRKKLIIPEIVITTCPDIEMPDIPPPPILRQSPSRPAQSQPVSSRSFVRKAAELRRSQATARAANTAAGCFSVSS